MDNNLPWIEKYRPTTLSDVAGHVGVISTVRKFVEKHQIPHLLFYGPAGTGKTSTIVAIARDIFGPHYKSKVLELNASDDRGIDVVREQIKTFASTRQIFSGSSDSKAPNFKLVILDEADSMTNVAQNALRRIIEKYSAHTRFCILANYTHKLNPALVSRCTRFRFSPLSREAVEQRLRHVILEEKISISEPALEALIGLSHGDMRRALNVLQACHSRSSDGSSAGIEITEAQIYECVGSPDPRDIERILQSLLRDEWSQCLELVTKMKLERGLALADILTEVGQEFIGLELPTGVRQQVLAGLADIEYRLSSGGSEKLQTAGMIGVVKAAQE